MVQGSVLQRLSEVADGKPVPLRSRTEKETDRMAGCGTARCHRAQLRRGKSEGLGR